MPSSAVCSPLSSDEENWSLGVDTTDSFSRKFSQTIVRFTDTVAIQKCTTLLYESLCDDTKQPTTTTIICHIYTYYYKHKKHGVPLLSVLVFTTILKNSDIFYANRGGGGMWHFSALISWCRIIVF